MSGYFKDKDPIELRWSLPLLNIVAIAGIFLMLVRLWHLQVMDADYYSELSLNNRLRLVKSTAPRGLIYDRNGIRIVENRPGFDLMVVPEDVTDWDGLKVKLKRLADIDGELIDEKVAKAKRRAPFIPVKLKEDMTWEETAKIESFKFELPGVDLDVSPKRSYLYGVAFAHMVGYLGEINERELKEFGGAGSYSGGDMVGKFAIERKLEDTLRGVDGGRKVEVDALGRRIREVNSTPPEPGNDIRLTLDLKTQIAAWSAMKDKVGAVVALEPSTGRVIAMVSTPSFDPNQLTVGVSHEEWVELVNNPLNILTNRATQGQYPPASTLKPLVAAAALDEAVITPWTEIFSGPSFNFAGRDYRDWKEEGHGDITVHEAIVESSDTFFYQVGLKLGVDTIAGHLKSFGLGSRTGIDVVDEKPGLVPSSDWKRRVYGERWYDGETLSISVGQGFMLATPLNVAVAYSAIANGGTVYRPQVVEEVTTPAGETLSTFAPVTTGTVTIKKETLERIRGSLRGVVAEKHGTASVLRSSPAKIAGKTGTAQVARLVERVEDIEDIKYRLRDHAWFAGYAPYDDPKVVVVVLVEHGGFGARAAAPIAKEVFEAYLDGRDAEPPATEGL